MVPTILASALPAEFVAPLDEPYIPLEESVTGGIHVGDGSQGRQIQRWTAFYEGGSIKVASESGTVEFTLAVAGVQTLSLAFDSNMAVNLAYQTAAGANLYYFDSITGLPATMTIAGATSCRAATDDSRDFFNAQSDVIFAYTLAGNLYLRVQRERYQTARLVGPASGNMILLRAGQNTLHRLQFKLGKYYPPLQ